MVLRAALLRGRARLHVWRWRAEEVDVAEVAVDLGVPAGVPGLGQLLGCGGPARRYALEVGDLLPVGLVGLVALFEDAEEPELDDRRRVERAPILVGESARVGRDRRHAR